MANNNATYRIIDEPKVKPWTHLIVNPLVILFAAILVPLFISLPFNGRIWMPMLWLLINSFLLGSPTFKTETALAMLGAALYFLLPTLYVVAVEVTGADTQIFLPYVSIVLQAVFFVHLYLIVFKQSVP